MTTVKIVTKSKKRKGQGHGSGKVKTGGRGYKGQNARNPLSIGHSHYEGGQRPLTKRLPYLRGKGNAKVSVKPYLLSLTALSKLAAGTVVDIEFLVKSKLINRNQSVKILNNGKLDKALTVRVPAAKNAIEAIKKAGGTYEVITEKAIESESPVAEEKVDEKPKTDKNATNKVVKSKKTSKKSK